jgi:hypothetical protein
MPGRHSSVSIISDAADVPLAPKASDSRAPFLLVPRAKRRRNNNNSQMVVSIAEYVSQTELGYQEEMMSIFLQILTLGALTSARSVCSDLL